MQKTDSQNPEWMKKNVTLAVILIPLGILAVYWIVQLIGSLPVYHGNVIDPPVAAADFTLQTDQGNISLSDFRGKTVLLFFGYTACPDVCPVTLSKVARALEGLGDAAEDIQTIFISVDPERDSPQQLGTYARIFNPGFIGGTNSPDEIARIAELYGIHYSKHDTNSAGGYLVDHTSSIWVIDRHGNKRLLWSNDIEPSDMASDLTRIVKEP